MRGDYITSRRWEKLRSSIDGTIAVQSSIPWYKQCNSIGRKQYGDLRSTCKNLFELCCLKLAYELTVHTQISMEHQREILEGCYDGNMVRMIWEYVLLLSKDTILVYCLFHSYKLKPNFVLGGKALHYRFQSLHQNLSLIEFIRFMNRIPRMHHLRFLTIIDIDCQMEHLEKMPNLKCLGAISLKCQNITELLKQWHRAVAIDPGRWQDLKLLRLPQLHNMKLFYDTFRILPSLECLEVGIEPSLIKQVPILARLVKYESSQTRCLSYAYANLCQFKATELERDVLFDFQIRKQEFDSPIHYSPQNTESVGPLYSYTLRQPIGEKTLKSIGEISHQSAFRANKRPKSSRLNTGSTAQQFFGF